VSVLRAAPDGLLSRDCECSGGRRHGLFMTEVIHRHGRWRSFEAVEFATLEWVDWLFNNQRLLEPIVNIPPAEAEAARYAKLGVMPRAA